MEDFIEEDAYADEYDYAPEPRRGMSGWLIALIVVLALIVLCCICAFLAVAGIAVLSPTMEGTFPNFIETLEAATPVP